MNSKSYDRITERIVSLLAQGTVPWHKPWSIKTGMPRNLISQKPYRGINVFLLLAMNYESPHWLTLRQANLLSGQIKPGEKSCPVVFWKPMKVKDKETSVEKKIPFLRLYHVFNVAQCTGLKNIPPADDSAFVQTMPAEIVAQMPQPPAIKHGMAAACYSPVRDTGRVRKFLLKTPAQRQQARAGIAAHLELQRQLAELSELNTELLRRGAYGKGLA